MGNHTEPNFHQVATDVVFSAQHEDWHETREKLEEALVLMYLSGVTRGRIIEGQASNLTTQSGVTENLPPSEGGDASSILASGTISAPQADGAGCDCLSAERCGVCHYCQRAECPGDC